MNAAIFVVWSPLFVIFLHAATSIGIVHGSAQDSLRTVRAEINLFTNDFNEDGEEQLAKNWRFLDSGFPSTIK